MRSDVPALVALLHDGALDASRETDELASYHDALDEIDRTANNYVLVAEYGDAVVGMLQLLVFRHLQHRGGRCAEIESMFVAPHHRNSGIGGMLLERAASRARDLGCYRIQLTSNLRREESHRFYEQHGFLHTHRGYKRLLD